MNEYDAFCGLKQASEKSKLLVYPDNIRPKAKRDWTRVIQVIIAVIISGVVGYGMF